ncbi:hypothetical protein THAOC_09011 [Thalassiosira oceanica]|uniref:Uncharacterized protein n=1 Tax=Thalassiosira oceanica TaxID=159749 RepID=K0SXP5_THAOC|nr:hypothetical protein THAOC_09011 [Thalassiosira oceanica]|eukprot:EJK69704.1 hypothetical protein THAOC_09011 [Thalassiosira oceanica]
MPAQATMHQRTSHPRRLLLIAVIFIGHCSRCSIGFNAPFQGATAVRRDLLQLRNHGDGDETDAANKTERVEGESKDESNLYTWAELQADPELRETVSALGWLFVGCGLILNQFGLAVSPQTNSRIGSTINTNYGSIMQWVPQQSGGIRVGTLDQLDFQKELMREKRREAKQTSAVSSSATKASAERWLKQDRVETLS